MNWKNLFPSSFLGSKDSEEETKVIEGEGEGKVIINESVYDDADDD